MLSFSFWILLAANIVLFVFQQSYMSPSVEDRREPERMLFQYHPERITLSTPETIQKITTAAAAPTTIQQTAAPCLEISLFSQAEAAQFETRLTELSLNPEQIQRIPVPESPGYMVYIPPQKDKKSTDNKIAELKKHQIKDYFLIQDNTEMNGVISLGVFKTEETAKQYMEQLQKQGISDARMTLRASLSEKFLFRLNEISPEKQQNLDKILADFPAQKKQQCSVP